MAELRSFVDRFLGRDLTTNYASELKEAQSINFAQSLEVGRLQESMRELSLYLEDLKWVPINGWQEYEGFSLDTIKEQADRLQALVTVNPTIKKAINARIGYIWSKGVKIEGTGVKKIMEMPRNESTIFGDIAHATLEVQLATDGNVWAVRDKRNDEVSVAPIKHIAGWVLDDNDPTRVNYWLREYTVTIKNFATGVETSKLVKEFIPAHDYTGPASATHIDGIPINRNLSIVHLAANRQRGWILGIPDLMAAMFWAKAHKELFEAGTTYVKAQGQFASKVVNKNPLGGQNAAATLRDAPRRDPDTGEIMDVGGTAVMTGGLDYQLMGKMSGGVDFNAFDPVAGLVAVGLGIPLHVILGDSPGENESLEDSTVSEMMLRQSLWTSFYKALFVRTIKVVWPKIKTEPEYRRIQAISLTAVDNLLSREEMRMLTLEGYGIEGDPKDLPAIEDTPAIVLAKAKAKLAIMQAEATAPDDDEEQTTPKQGVTGKVGKLSTGKDAKASRDNPGDRNTKGQ